MALPITITDAGRAEIINSQNTGTGPVTITEIGFGGGQYNPAKGQTALSAQVKRLSSIAGQAVAPDTIHVMAKDESADAYNVGEFGLFSDKGTLIAVYSQPAASGWIIQKAGASTLLLATDIILESLNAQNITFGDILFINPPATETVAGVTMLVNNLASNRQDAALTAAMGKKLQDEKEPAIAAGSVAQYWRGDKNWRDFATDVRAAVLTGLSTTSAAAVAATDSVLTALGKLQAQVTGLSNSKLDSTANAVSATKLQTARSIGGVPFDGTSNINLPGVNAAGNQNTSGNAATATKLANARTINGVPFDGTANVTVEDGTKEPAIAAGRVAQYWRGDKNWRDFATDVRAAVLTGLSTASAAAVAGTDSVLTALGKLQAQVTGLSNSKLDSTANAVSATKLQTARSIGGVPFDGTSNINLPGVNAAGNQNTSGNAATATKLATPRTISLVGGASGAASFDGSGNVSITVDVPDITLLAGAVMSFARSTAPNGWLKANGAAVSRTTYAALFAAIGTAYGAGNGSTTFNLPDLRGEFIRGWDDGRGVDAGRAFGSWQGDDVKAHTHTQDFIRRVSGNGNVIAGNQPYAGLLDPYQTLTIDTSSSGGIETRPRNVAMLACIKY